MPLEIEKNIPVPGAGGRFNCKPYIRLARKMQVGDSFKVTPKDVAGRTMLSVRASIAVALKRDEIVNPATAGRRFTTRILPDDVLRVWRVE